MVVLAYVITRKNKRKQNTYYQLTGQVEYNSSNKENQLISNKQSSSKRQNVSNYKPSPITVNVKNTWHCSNGNCPNMEVLNAHGFCPDCGSSAVEEFSMDLVNKKVQSRSSLQRQVTQKISIQRQCQHLRVINETVYEVCGEPRRVVKKCLDCGKVVESTSIGR